MRRRRALPVVAVAAAVAACATATNAAGPASRNLITAAELAETNAQNAYEAVRVLQPQWLQSRGPSSLTDMTPTGATVFVNGVEAGDASYLRNLGIQDIAEIRYYEPGTAAARFGMGHPRGVIDVILKGEE
ncbi:MAG TPA: TonB-dependent receptor plug domain-containing protein [Longimicrobiales bacterium]